jgi:hypothetical protein
MKVRTHLRLPVSLTGKRSFLKASLFVRVNGID